MSGHSKWKTIKIRKQKQDKLRGKIFTKVTREIIVAAREGGENPEINLRLKKAIEKAKEVNMPQENIKRAILRGVGKLEGASYEEFTVEGYGPDGVAIMVEALSDNKQRTLSEIRSIFSKGGGSLGEAGCVSWLFKKKGIIAVDKDTIDENTLITLALESGAQDVNMESTHYEIITEPQDFDKVKNYLIQNNVNISHDEITLIPSSLVRVEGEKAQKVLKLMYALEELDDVQNVYSNFDIPDKDVESVS